MDRRDVIPLFPLPLVVLPGEGMRVFVLKEGKEAGQGVGYLDDGTMVGPTRWNQMD